MTASGGRKRHRVYGALAAAAVVHAVGLFWLGSGHPTLEEPHLAGAPPIVVDLLPSLDRTATPALAQAASHLAARAARVKRAPPPRLLAADTVAPEPITAPTAIAPEETLGCEPEVLILLTGPERERCRNQIETAAARRAERTAAAELLRRLEEARRQAPVDVIAPDKRASYDAVQTAKASVRGDFRMRGLPRRNGLATSSTNIDINVSGRCTLSLGGGRSARPRCPVAPPVGALTEESRIPQP